MVYILIPFDCGSINFSCLDQNDFNVHLISHPYVCHLGDLNFEETFK
jgi:hypothetical protein